MKNIKIFSALCLALVTLLVFSACTSLDIRATYKITSIELHGADKNLVNFNLHKDADLEFRLERNHKATCSFIYFTAVPHEDGVYYYANVSNNITTFRTNDTEVIINGAIVGAGTLEIEVHGEILILAYFIDDDLIYIARYRKT